MVQCGNTRRRGICNRLLGLRRVALTAAVEKEVEEEEEEKEKEKENNDDDDEEGGDEDEDEDEDKELEDEDERRPSHARIRLPAAHLNGQHRAFHVPDHLELRAGSAAGHVTVRMVAR